MTVSLDFTHKALPPGVDTVDVDALAGRGWTIFGGEVPLPAAVLKQSVLKHNSRWMHDYTKRLGVKFAPHGKTTMSPDLFAMQLADGAWGITAATAAHVRTYCHFGISKILMANQLVGAANIKIVADELKRNPKLEFYCLVDSIDGLTHLAEHLAQEKIGRPIKLLVEVGALDGRTGTRTMEEAMALAQAIGRHAPHVVLAGVECFEGIYMASGESDADTANVTALMAQTATVAEAIDRAGLFGDAGIVLTAGGSAYFDIVAETLTKVKLSRPHEVIVRAGCYLIHDHGNFSAYFEAIAKRSSVAAGIGSSLQPALEVWALVQSRPEPNRVIVNAGKRDVSYDMSMPHPVAWLRSGETKPRALTDGSRVLRLNDQHGYMEVPADSPLRVGDLVGLGISHPCTTFDKWRFLYVVDDDYKIVSAVRTFF